MTLERNLLEKYEPNRRNPQDNRKRIAWAVFSYIDTMTGDEYRKSFNATPHTSEIDFFTIAPKQITQ